MLNNLSSKWNDLKQKPFRICEKYKIWYTISAAIIGVGIIFMIIFGVTQGAPFNFGIDFVGGTELTVNVGNGFADHKDKITKVIQDDIKQLGASKTSAVQYIGSPITGLTIKFSAIDGMDIDTLTESLRNPDDPNSLYSRIKTALGSEYKGELEVFPKTMSASASQSLLTTTILSLVVAIFLILIYITIRFEMTSGFITIMTLIHDGLIVCAFMAIARIQLEASFIAALITIVGYSINSTIVVFDRIRENMKKSTLKSMTPTQIANLSIKETLTRSINTTVTTLFTIVVLACFPIPNMQVFALPIIVGLLAGTYSSVFLSGTTWALFRMHKSKKKPKTEAKPQATVAE